MKFSTGCRWEDDLMISAESTGELLVDTGVRDGEEGSAGKHGGRQG